MYGYMMSKYNDAVAHKALEKNQLIALTRFYGGYGGVKRATQYIRMKHLTEFDHCEDIIDMTINKLINNDYDIGKAYKLRENGNVTVASVDAYITDCIERSIAVICCTEESKLMRSSNGKFKMLSGRLNASIKDSKDPYADDTEMLDTIPDELDLEAFIMEQYTDLSVTEALRELYQIEAVEHSYGLLTVVFMQLLGTEQGGCAKLKEYSTVVKQIFAIPAIKKFKKKSLDSMIKVLAVLRRVPFEDILVAIEQEHPGQYEFALAAKRALEKGEDISDDH